jgi:hypothetical protein
MCDGTHIRVFLLTIPREYGFLFEREQHRLAYI